MSHVFFFSYARENLDKELKAFFEDLCTEVAPYTGWAADDSQISFRDGRDLPLMEQWEPAIMEAIQTSAVLVCVTSLAYFQKRFCGQEYWVFDRRRRQNLQAGDSVPAVVLPVIWAPVEGGLPPFMDEVQWQEFRMPDTYSKKGLRYLKKLDPNLYDKCVTAFAEAIKGAWQKYPAIPRVPGVAPFDQIPNAFAGGQWEDAAGPTGWLLGPGVANFVFAVAQAKELPSPVGRYGPTASQWRPFLPPVARTISDIAQAAAKKHSLRYREILVNAQLHHELNGARDRKNLTLVLADARSLQIQQYHEVQVFDGEIREGAALLIPWNDDANAWDATAFPAVANLFHIKSQLKPPAFLAPIYTAEDFDKLLDITLADLRGALTRVETEKKAKTDDAPAQVVGPGETSP